ILVDGCDHIESIADLDARLREKRPLRVKLGLDPTTSDLHIGHAVVLHKLQQFVEAGHDVTLIIGDFTGRIGDPSGRNEMRPPLSEDQIRANMTTYAEQAGKILDMERVSVRYNSEWLAKLTLSDLLRLLSQVTVARMLDRNDFSQRYKANEPIALHEFLYPVAQAYDSIAINAEIELGGNDQLFNLLMGRQYQAWAGQREQVCMTVPLLEGLDGEKKMSKTAGNFVGIAEDARTQFGKLMRIPDELIPRYARLAAFRSEADSLQLAGALGSGSAHPMDEKKKLAQEIVARYHGAEEASGAREYFEQTVQRRELPTDHVPEVTVGSAKRVSDVLVASGLAESKRAAERLIMGNGVKVDGAVVTDPRALWAHTQPVTLSVGARRFVRVLPNR
ncbi:MAG: tyrosine--tRNA ligase, partial [Candidatus Eremiobacteraeota bacterium]|nr:tyrosine--tRNA ligase [Candidatus Eremiobacteraeota bacterium]